jgi:hypothetical protein
MKLKATLIAASLALGMALAGSGRAGAPPGRPYPPGFLKNLMEQMVSHGQSLRAGYVSEGESNSGNMPPGLNTMHATNCVAAQSGLNVMGCIFSVEGLYVCALNPSAAASATAGAACANGNYIQVNIYDNTGDANLIVSWPSK